MRRLMKACALIGVAIGAVGLSSAQTTISFSDGGLTPGLGPDPWFPGNPKGTNVSDQFLTIGARFNTVNGVSYASDAAHCTGTSGLNWDTFLAVNSTPPLGQPAVLHVTFWDLNNLNNAGWVEGGSISVKVSDRDSRPFDRIFVRTFDLADAIVEQRTLNQYEDTFIFTTGRIHEIQFIDNGADGFVMDDLSFGAVTITPEPATLAALGLGIGSLLLRRRRR